MAQANVSYSYGRHYHFGIRKKDGYTIITTMDFGSKEARNLAISTDMTDGVEMSYQLLDKLVTEPV